MDITFLKGFGVQTKFRMIGGGKSITFSEATQTDLVIPSGPISRRCTPCTNGTTSRLTTVPRRRVLYPLGMPHKMKDQKSICVSFFQILRSIYEGEARAVPVHIYYPRRSYFMEFLPFCVTLIAQVGRLAGEPFRMLLMSSVIGR